MKKKTIKDKSEKIYKATVKIMGKPYESTGNTILEAISKLSPKNCKGSCVITVQNGDVIKHKIVTSFMTARLFNMVGLTREIALKNTSLLFLGI